MGGREVDPSAQDQATTPTNRTPAAA